MVLLPTTSQAAPQTGSLGSTVDFGVRANPNGIGDIVGVQFFIRFDPAVLELVSITHINTTLQSPSPIRINDVAGTALFAAFTTTPLSPGQEAFDFATLSFMAKTTGDGTQVIFEVGGEGKTFVTDTLGQNLLADTADFIGAWITVVP